MEASISDVIKEWHYALYKGRITNHVACGEDRPERIVASIETSVSKGKLDLQCIQRMLDEIHDETIRPFSNDKQQERLQRFREIKICLKQGSRYTMLAD